VLYSQVNYLQQQFGKKLAFTAEITHGDKVLDIGKQTQVVGVDPGIERSSLVFTKILHLYMEIVGVHFPISKNNITT
jgi:hypothetical protein